MGEEAGEIEVIDGVPVAGELMGRQHGRIGFDVGLYLGLHVGPNRLGKL